MTRIVGRQVVVRELGIPHYCAFCDECDWTYQDYRNRRLGQRKIRRHVLETGHRIRLEKGTITEYVLEDVEQ